MQKVLTAAQMREVDRLTTEKYGIPSIILMENAAHAVARVITEKLGGSVKGKSILILCGPGNNGGDGAALARIFWQNEAVVDVILFGKVDEAKGDAKVNLDFLNRIEKAHSDPRIAGANNIYFFEEDELGEDFTEVLQDSFRESEIVVDALLGTGITRSLSGRIAGCVSLLNQSAVPVISIDIPSGLLSDSGGTVDDPSVFATTTISFTAPKTANVLPPASRKNGELVIKYIGTPAELIDQQDSQLFFAEEADSEHWLVKSDFNTDSYKNKRGHALVIAGSESYSGAAILAGNAAMRSGVGLVTVVTPKSSKDSVASRILPEVMVRGVSETEIGSISEGAFDEIEDLLVKADSVAIGCGLSQDESTKRFVEDVVFTRRHPVIVDADALNLLSPFAGFAANGESQFPLILTPHDGEFMRLLGTDDKDAIKDRVTVVRDFAVKHNVFLVLKGERVLIGEPSGKVVVNPTGNSGLGKAGNGDTLTGILAGFVAQASVMNIEIFETVVAAVYVAGMAGDVAEGKYGKRVMTASDVRECLSEVFERLSNER